MVAFPLSEHYADIQLSTAVLGLMNMLSSLHSPGGLAPAAQLGAGAPVVELSRVTAEGVVGKIGARMSVSLMAAARERFGSLLDMSTPLDDSQRAVTAVGMAMSFVDRELAGTRSRVATGEKDRGAKGLALHKYMINAVGAHVLPKGACSMLPFAVPPPQAQARAAAAAEAPQQAGRSTSGAAGAQAFNEPERLDDSAARLFVWAGCEATAAAAEAKADISVLCINQASIWMDWEASLATHVPKQCRGCFNPGCLSAPGTVVGAHKLQVCSGCKVASFCGKECARAAWGTVHKHTCKHWAAAKAAGSQA